MNSVTFWRGLSVAIMLIGIAYLIVMLGLVPINNLNDHVPWKIFGPVFAIVLSIVNLQLFRVSNKR